MNVSSLAQQLPNKLLSSQESQLVSPQALPSSPDKSQDSLSLAEKRQAALQVVDETLSRAYQKISSRGLSATESYQAFEPLTAEKVANNILGFIERRLRMDQADGATQEQLEARLEAGLSGFNKGFAEAQEKLKALDMLSPEIASDIDNTYELVTKGIDKLREQLLGGVVPKEAPVESANPVSEPVSTPLEKKGASPVRKSSQPEQVKPGDGVDSLEQASSQFKTFAQLGAASARDFSFELTTREGDHVRIRASASQSMGMAYQATGRGDSRSVDISGAYSNSQSFSLDIEGDLNEEELGAITDLLGKVNHLAADFYAGNLDEAWEQALHLGFDQNQIGQYSLSLTQVDIKVVQVNEQETRSQAGASSLLAAQGFMKSFQDVLELASKFPQSIKLLEDLAARMDELYAPTEENNSRFADFMVARLAEV